MRTPDRPVPVFFYVVAARQIQPGDVLYEINDRPLRGGAMIIREVRHHKANRDRRDGWELVAEASRVSRFVDADARLRIGRTPVTRRVNPVVAAAAASIRKPKTQRRKNSRSGSEQLSLFDLPEGR